MAKGYTLDVPVDLNEKRTNVLENIKRILHLVSGFATFLTICLVAPIIATQVKYNGGSSPGPNYTLFVAIISLPIPFLLVFFPWMYERQNKFKRLGKFCLKNRTNFIFIAFHTLLWATAGIASTVNANNASTCTPDSEKQKSGGDDYTSAWATQCNLSKVVAGFAWVTCVLWLLTMFCNGIFFWKEKSGIQQNLAEHRKNKMAKLQEEQEEEDEEYRLHQQQNYDSYNGNRNSSAYYEEELHNDASPFADPIHDPHQNAFYTPAPPQHNQGFELNAPPVGQYVNNSTTGFSPMPQPQHMPPHPEPTYYNREQQYGNTF